uniref:Neurofilament-like protein n=1 Tax=Loligo forbesii TaxID=6618 RepID=Q06829_LOLFO|nr:neurofilament-like protein [Loligo forbesii]
MEDSSSEVTVNREVTTDNPYTISVTNKTLSAIRIKMFMPRAYELKVTVIKMAFELSTRCSKRDGVVETVLTDVIEGKTMSGYDRSGRVNLLNFNNQVIFRVVRKTLDSNDSNVVDAIQVRSYAEVIDAKFRYPLTGLLFVEFDSKMFPNQLLTISIRKRWKIVNVRSNYDHESRTYNGNWDGTFKKAWTNNRAWVLYDLMINQRYGLDQKELGISVDKWALYEAAQYCDQMVLTAKAARNLATFVTCKLVIIQSQTDAYKVVRDICSIFRGMSFWNGESISVIIDRTRELAYIFTNDNVVNGDFSYTSQARRACTRRATGCLMMSKTCINRTLSQYSIVEGHSTVRNNVTSITAIGAHVEAKANRRGRWILKTNLRSTTVNFATGLEGMIRTIGDVVAISDNFWSSNLTMNLSRRLLEGSGSQIFLPLVDARAGDFIIVNNADGKPVKRTISSVSADGKTIELTSGFGFPVKPNTVFAIDRTDLRLQQYVVTKIDKADDDEEFTSKSRRWSTILISTMKLITGLTSTTDRQASLDQIRCPKPENVKCLRARESSGRA